MMSAAEPQLQALVKACASYDQWFIAEGEVSTLKSAQGFLGLVKSSRRGLALQPDQETGSFLNTQFPRINRSDFPEDVEPWWALDGRKWSRSGSAKGVGSPAHSAGLAALISLSSTQQDLRPTNAMRATKKGNHHGIRRNGHRPRDQPGVDSQQPGVDGVQALISQLDSLVAQISDNWKGTDSANFASEWTSSHRTNLMNVHSALVDFHTRFQPEHPGADRDFLQLTSFWSPARFTGPATAT